MSTCEAKRSRIDLSGTNISGTSAAGELPDNFPDLIRSNGQTLRTWVQRAIPAAQITPDSTVPYLRWLDFRWLTGHPTELCTKLSEQENLLLAQGDGRGRGMSRHVRINLACPAPVLAEALSRLERAIPAYEQFALARC